MYIGYSGHRVHEFYFEYRSDYLNTLCAMPTGHQPSDQIIFY